MPRPATFRNQLMLTMLGFVLLAELIVAAAILRATYEQTMSQARASIAVGERVLDQVMTLRRQQLLTTVDVLASDFGFKSAVATHDGPTLRSVLTNFGNRAHADIAMLVDPSGQLMATVPQDDTRTGTLPFADLLAHAQREGSAAGLIITGNRAYQFALAPVNAPRLIAWVGMGFQIDHALARDLASLSGLEVGFILAEGDNVISRTGTLSQVPNKPASAAAEEAFVAERHVLLDAGDTRLDVVLALPRSEVLSAYYDLARSLLLVFSVTLLVSALTAIWLARKISEPVRKLSRFAESVAAGHYTEAPQIGEIGELNVLSDTLRNMQAAVRHREDHMRHLALHDPLTGLPNRESMRQTLEQYFKDQRPFAALRIGIHGFSRINSTLGYQQGDEVLQTVAERLRAVLGTQPPLGRIEGNDFLVLVECGDDESTLRADIGRIRASVETPIYLAITPVTLILEIGVIMAPQLATDIETVWRRSVIARNYSRDDNGRTFFYQSGMDETRMRELSIIQDLAPALEKNELRIVYQPKMLLRSGTVCQVEALARWVHPDLGPVPPDEFVSLAERSGQINLLTQWIVGQLTAQVRRWRSQGMELGVALNLSADELADEHLAHMIAPLLDAASTRQRITLEVTETALLRDPAAALANLRQLQALGARIAIDDFGAGYSSLAQLKQLGVNELKIDKSLILKLDTTPADQFIVQMIIDLGHKLGLEVVAEGVENAATWRYLVEQGADIMQGYFLARPLEADKLADWVRNHGLDEMHWCARTILGGGFERPWKHLNS